MSKRKVQEPAKPKKRFRVQRPPIAALKQFFDGNAALKKKRAEFSLEEIGKTLNPIISASTLSAVFTGQRAPSRRLTEALSQFLYGDTTSPAAKTFLQGLDEMVNPSSSP